MEMYLGFFLVILKLTSTFATTPNTLNEGYGGDDTGCPLRTDLYTNTCPEAEDIVFSRVADAISEDPRMAASLLRLHFHDCFVNARHFYVSFVYRGSNTCGMYYNLLWVFQGCDASVLLDDTQDFVGEKTATPNLNSLRGFEVIDAIKSDLESVCPETVSCADILAIVARDSVVLSEGPSWEVLMGRRDSLGASKATANNNIPPPNSTVAMLVAKFQNVGLGLNDMVALSGAHTIGKARCSTFSSQLQSSSSTNRPDINLDFIASLQQLCSETDFGTTALAQLDLVTPATFDNQYYVNLISGEGLLPSDQALVTGDDQTRAIVETYAEDTFTFFEDFKNSMLKMGSLGPLSENNGDVRRNCRIVN
ncbi:Peroxidase [Quillaja saponaria]|uniref:Peroxidase n=1 Tax=Quillaja saponaria TaxID=32244 RepID=A0AAD7QF99_QUISA|nr:Peroxidase [Quillaja saponaria]